MFLKIQRKTRGRLAGSPWFSLSYKTKKPRLFSRDCFAFYLRYHETVVSASRPSHTQFHESLRLQFPFVFRSRFRPSVLNFSVRLNPHICYHRKPKTAPVFILSAIIMRPTQKNAPDPPIRGIDVQKGDPGITRAVGRGRCPCLLIHQVMLRDWLLTYSVLVPDTTTT